MMIDRQYLQDLLSILKLHGVASIKMQGLELAFHVERGPLASTPMSLPEQGPVPLDSLEAIADTIRKQEEAMPPDLRADTLMDQDKILNWSSPDQNLDEPPLPLTGEEPL